MAVLGLFLRLVLKSRAMPQLYQAKVWIEVMLVKKKGC